jgi:hypothetical protein
MTLTINSRVQHKITGKEGTVHDIEIHLTDGIRLRYFNVFWDNARKSSKLYLNTEMLEIEPQASQTVSLFGEISRFKQFRLHKSLILNKNKVMLEFDVVKFLNPGINDDKLQCTIDSSCNLFDSQVNRQKTKRYRQNEKKRVKAIPESLTIRRLITDTKQINANNDVLDLTVSSDSEQDTENIEKTNTLNVGENKQPSNPLATKTNFMDLTGSSDSERPKKIKALLEDLQSRKKRLLNKDNCKKLVDLTLNSDSD